MLYAHGPGPDDRVYPGGVQFACHRLVVADPADPRSARRVPVGRGQGGIERFGGGDIGRSEWK